MARLRRNLLSGTITNNPLLIGDTSLSSAELANLPAVASPDIMALILDPLAVNGVPEIVHVTAHTAAATTATILRGQETAVGGNAARQHPTGTAWLHGPTVMDVNPLSGQDSEPTGSLTNDLWMDTDEGAGVGLSSIIGYVQTTTPQTGIGTGGPHALTGLSVTVTVPAGRRIRVTGNVFLHQQTSAGTVTVRLFEAGVELQRIGHADLAISGGDVFSASWVGSPTAGAHTYDLVANTTANTVNTLSDPTRPAFILVEDITGTLWPAGQSIGAGAIANEAWLPWTPVLNNGILGNGTLTARYTRIGRTITASFSWVFGSTSDITTWFSVGGFPAPCHASGGIGSALMQDASTSFRAIGIVSMTGGASEGTIFSGINVGGHVHNTYPWDWASGDWIAFTVTYEAAS